MRRRTSTPATTPGTTSATSPRDLWPAGVGDAAGFYLNPSNYQFTENVVQYGTWISKCIDLGDYANCPNQYWNGGPLPTKIAELLGEWTGVALSSYGIWSDESDDPALNTSGINFRYGATEGATHFVVDTSRNGQGPWQPDAAIPIGTRGLVQPAGSRRRHPADAGTPA